MEPWKILDDIAARPSSSDRVAALLALDASDWDAALALRSSGPFAARTNITVRMAPGPVAAELA